MKCTVKEIKSTYKDEVERRMKDPQFATGSMLRSNLDLVKIIQADKQRLEAYGVTPKDLYERVHHIITQSKLQAREYVEFPKFIQKSIPSFIPNVTFLQTVMPEGVLPDVRERCKYTATKVPYHPEWCPRRPTISTFGDFEIITHPWASPQKCPFSVEDEQNTPHKDFLNTDYLIKNLKTKQWIVMSGTALHLIGIHECFERSHNNHYTIHPIRLVALLNIEKKCESMDTHINPPIRLAF